jgi:ABC-type nitrate/sulfonate/bicarbonate transport system substrate-binding protein
MKTKLLAALVVFLAVDLGAHDLFAQLKKVRLSLPSRGTNSILYGLAAEKGFFREEGLEVEQINMRGSLGVKALIGGDVGYSAASGSIITAALRGLKVKLVSVLSPTPIFRMIAQKNIDSIKDLKGKVVGLSSRGGTLDHLTRIMLEKNGLVPEKDVTLVVVGGQQVIWNAIRTDRIGAALVNLPGYLILGKEGFRDIGAARDYFAYHPTGGLGVADEKIAKDRDEVVAFIRATLKARKLYLDDRAAGIKATIKHGGLTDESLAAATYDEYKHDLSPDGLADEKWMKQAMDFILKVTKTKEKIAPSQVFDFSLTREALARVN